MILTVAGLLAYHNSFTGPFIFDDIPSIQENPTIRHLWPIWDALAPPHKGGITVEGRPVINLSLAINFALGGTEVWGYHALNLAIHILAGLTLLGIMRRTLLQPRLRERFGDVANELALAVAVIWTVHPLQTESVTYIVQRAESLMGLFYLLTLYCFIRTAESPRPRVWYGLCVSACTLGMASKEVMASAPLLMMLYDRTFISGSFPEAWRRRWPLYLALTSTWILLGCLMVFTGSFSNALVNARLVGVSRWEYLLTEPGVILHYLRLSVWPHPLSFDYSGWPIARTWMSILPSAVVIAILLVATGWAWKTTSAWGFVGAWFFLILAPSSSFIPTDSPAYEHRLYLPLAAVVTLVVMRLYSLAGRRSVALFLVLAVGLGFLTVQRNQDYRSSIAIWADAVAKRPGNPRAQYNLGCDLRQEGRMQEAMEHWEQALRLKPDYAKAHYNLGVALVQLGRLPEAIGHYEQALRLKPDYAEAHYNLAAVLLRLGRLPEAMGHWEQVSRIRPDHPETDNNLAWLLATLAPTEGGDPVRAVTLAERACELTNNRVAEYLDTLAVAYAAAGRFSDAIATGQKAIELAGTAAQHQLVREIETRLKSYRAGQAWREPTASAGN